MPWPWNSSLLMLYGKRNLFLIDCTSDSWQTTLSLQVSGAETKLRTGLLPNLFEPARDAQMPAFTDAIAKILRISQNGVICFVLLLPSWPVSTLDTGQLGRDKKQDERQIIFYVCLICSFFSLPLLFFLVINVCATDVFHICENSRGSLGYVYCNWEAPRHESLLRLDLKRGLCFLNLDKCTSNERITRRGRAAFMELCQSQSF